MHSNSAAWEYAEIETLVYCHKPMLKALKENMKVDFVDSLSQKTFSAMVVVVAHALDPKNVRSCRLRCWKSKFNISSGRYVDVMWPLFTIQSYICCPIYQGCNDYWSQFCYRIHEGITEWVDVKRGNQYGIQ